MKNDRKQTILFIIILLVMSLGIGYAFLTTTLSIEGVSDIDSSSWDVHWDNVVIDDSSNIPSEQIISAPTIGSDTTSVSFHVNLKKPGDYYGFFVDAVNAGSLDAIIENVSYTVNNVEYSADELNDNALPRYLIYDASLWEDGSGQVKPFQLLKSGNRLKYYISFYYSTDITAEDLPDDGDESYTVSFGISYTQAQRREYYYFANSGGTINYSLDSGVTYYNDYQTAIQQIGNSPFFAYGRVQDDILTEAYVGFIYNGEEYLLRGGGATFDTNSEHYNYDSIYYDDNKSLLLSLFDDSCDYGDTHITCDTVDYHMTVQKDGNVSVSTMDYVSSIWNGHMRCGIMITG